MHVLSKPPRVVHSNRGLRYFYICYREVRYASSFTSFMQGLIIYMQTCQLRCIKVNLLNDYDIMYKLYYSIALYREIRYKNDQCYKLHGA